MTGTTSGRRGPAVKEETQKWNTVANSCLTSRGLAEATRRAVSFMWLLSWLWNEKNSSLLAKSMSLKGAAGGLEKAAAAS